MTRDTATCCLVELGEACTVQLAKDVSPSRNLALECDGSGTCFDRHALEVHISSEGAAELMDVIDLVDKSAAGYLAVILKCLDRLHTLQRGMGLSPTPLWALRTLYADNAFVNTGSIGGLPVSFKEARHAAYRAEQPAEPFFAMEFKGCDDHILAFVLTRFHDLFCVWAKVMGQLDIIHNKNFQVNAKEREANLALPLHALTLRFEGFRPVCSPSTNPCGLHLVPYMMKHTPFLAES